MFLSVIHQSIDFFSACGSAQGALGKGCDQCEVREEGRRPCTGSCKMISRATCCCILDRISRQYSCPNTSARAAYLQTVSPPETRCNLRCPSPARQDGASWPDEFGLLGRTCLGIRLKGHGGSRCWRNKSGTMAAVCQSCCGAGGCCRLHLLGLSCHAKKQTPGCRAHINDSKSPRCNASQIIVPIPPLVLTTDVKKKRGPESCKRRQKARGCAMQPMKDQ